MPDQSDYRAYADQMADKYGLPRPLFSGVISQESGFNQYDKYGRPLTSSSGAIGLGQLMPGTAADLGVNPYDWKQNLEGAAKYLSDQVKRFGRYDLALSAYNSGPGGTESNGQVAPNSQTQNYVSSILGKLGDQALDSAFDLLPGFGALPVDGSDTVKDGVETVSGGVKHVVDWLVAFFSKDTLIRTVAIVLGVAFLVIAVITMVNQSKVVQNTALSRKNCLSVTILRPATNTCRALASAREATFCNVISTCKRLPTKQLNTSILSSSVATVGRRNKREPTIMALRKRGGWKARITTFRL
jgi:hypothetical protein